VATGFKLSASRDELALSSLSSYFLIFVFVFVFVFIVLWLTTNGCSYPRVACQP
tara:strand:- start:174 stop:335 length:162 start_codon:yes stop_codon:yes gene_type:complete